MARYFFIAVLLIALVGCSSKHAFKGELQGAAPIAGSESFYAFASNEVTKERQTLIRLEPDGSFRPIREVDGSLWMKDQLADTSIVVTRNGDNLYLYSVISGELSALPKDYQYKSHWRKTSDRARDSLSKTALLKDIDPWLVYPLYAEDRYLIGADVPGTGGCKAEYENGGISFGMAMPERYFMVANMSKKSLTKIPGDHIECFSASEKSLLVLYSEDGNDYAQIVQLEDMLE